MSETPDPVHTDAPSGAISGAAGGSATAGNERQPGPVRVRFAPSPTGNLHIGGARTAIYNWAFAKSNGGTFILRIEDTDPERSTAENTEQIMRSLRWLGLNWDEGPGVGGDVGPYLQSERFGLYAQALGELKEKGAAYPCFCTPEELDAKRELARAEKRNIGYDRSCRNIPAEEAAKRIAAGEPHTWRLRLPEDRGAVVFDDLVYGSISTPSEQLDDFILCRSDGSPTYNFVVCVDDAMMGISHVIRGDDHISNTPKQILVYEALGRPVPTFAHLSMILGGDGKRLSKRHGATSVEAYKDAGYLPEALVNYLSLLGWSLDGETTLISTSELVAGFSLQRISRNPAVFDNAKLDWINQSYIKDMGTSAFIDAILPYLEAGGLAGKADVDERREWFEAIYPLVAERVKTLADVCATVAYLFSGPSVALDERSVEKCLRVEAALPALNASLAALEDGSLPWDAASIEAALRRLPESLEVKPKLVFQALRVAICGNMVSPPLFESIELIGRPDCCSRIRAAIALLED